MEEVKVHRSMHFFAQSPLLERCTFTLSTFGIRLMVGHKILALVMEVRTLHPKLSPGGHYTLEST